jgi:hypothetical protein
MIGFLVKVVVLNCGMRMMKGDHYGQVKPVALCAQPMKNVDEIVKGIFGIIKYWEKLSNEDSTGEYCRHY